MTYAHLNTTEAINRDGFYRFMFNGHIRTDGTKDKALVNDCIVIDERQIDTTFRDGRDPLHLSTGGTLGRSHKGFTMIRLSGRILVPNDSQPGSMADRERSFLACFDPSLCYHDSPTTEGAYALDFNEPTLDVAHYPSGVIPLRYYVRPLGRPRITEAIADGTMRRFQLGLVAGDPRQYEQTEQTISLTIAGPSANALNLGNVSAPMRITIFMNGPGAANFTITRAGVSFVLDLTSMVNGDFAYIVPETCGPYGLGRRILRNTVDAFSLKTSSAATWLDVPVGTTTFTISNTTNINTCSVSWFHTRA